ncbi:nuclear pore complex protein nup160 [Anaeramoeba flamelloides]|uniref:Nuclear pore complex protein nup160 n=1 Tax=Anaeramoeba flamelloides TaxID=1746091 RepID=A0ABQ8YD16_9EUKA|nr:nuclear pore complex protein nup160 [Anaeramoeba flamelloides]
MNFSEIILKSQLDSTNTRVIQIEPPKTGSTKLKKEAVPTKIFGGVFYLNHENKNNFLSWNVNGTYLEIVHDSLDHDLEHNSITLSFSNDIKVGCVDFYQEQETTNSLTQSLGVFVSTIDSIIYHIHFDSALVIENKSTMTKTYSSFLSTFDGLCNYFLIPTEYYITALKAKDRQNIITGTSAGNLLLFRFVKHELQTIEISHKTLTGKLWKIIPSFNNKNIENAILSIDYYESETSNQTFVFTQSCDNKLRIWDLNHQKCINGIELNLETDEERIIKFDNLTNKLKIYPNLNAFQNKTLIIIHSTLFKTAKFYLFEFDEENLTVGKYLTLNSSPKGEIIDFTLDTTDEILFCISYENMYSQNRNNNNNNSNNNNKRSKQKKNKIEKDNYYIYYNNAIISFETYLETPWKECFTLLNELPKIPVWEDFSNKEEEVIFEEFFDLIFERGYFYKEILIKSIELILKEKKINLNNLNVNFNMINNKKQKQITKYNLQDFKKYCEMIINYEQEKLIEKNQLTNKKFKKNDYCFICFNFFQNLLKKCNSIWKIQNQPLSINYDQKTCLAIIQKKKNNLNILRKCSNFESLLGIIELISLDVECSIDTHFEIPLIECFSFIRKTTRNYLKDEFILDLIQLKDPIESCSEKLSNLISYQLNQSQSGNNNDSKHNINSNSNINNNKNNNNLNFVYELIELYNRIENPIQQILKMLTYFEMIPNEDLNMSNKDIETKNKFKYINKSFKLRDRLSNKLIDNILFYSFQQIISHNFYFIIDLFFLIIFVYKFNMDSNIIETKEYKVLINEIIPRIKNILNNYLPLYWLSRMKFFTIQSNQDPNIIKIGENNKNDNDLLKINNISKIITKNNNNNRKKNTEQYILKMFITQNRKDINKKLINSIILEKEEEEYFLKEIPTNSEILNLLMRTVNEYFWLFPQQNIVLKILKFLNERKQYQYICDFVSVINHIYYNFRNDWYHAIAQLNLNNLEKAFQLFQKSSLRVDGKDNWFLNTHSFDNNDNSSRSTSRGGGGGGQNKKYKNHKYALIDYFLLVIDHFEMMTNKSTKELKKRIFDYIIKISNYAIYCVGINNPKSSIFYSKIFYHSINNEDYEQAYSTIINNPNSKISEKCLKHLILIMCNGTNNKESLLFKIISPKYYNILTETLQWKAKSIKITNLFIENKSKNYYLSLFSFLIQTNNFREASKIMFELATRIQSLYALTNSLIILSEIENYLLTSLNCLLIVERDFAWFLSEKIIDPREKIDSEIGYFQESNKRKYNQKKKKPNQFQLQEVNDSNSEKEIITPKKIKSKYLFFSSLNKLEKDFNITLPIDISFEELIFQYLIKYLLFDLVFAIATHEELDLIKIFKQVTKTCIKIQSKNIDYKPQIIKNALAKLQYYTIKLDSKETNFAYHNIVFATILSNNFNNPKKLIKIPFWLIKSYNEIDTEGLLRNYIQFQLFDKAVNIAIQMISNVERKFETVNKFFPNSVHLPYFLFDNLLKELNNLENGDRLIREFKFRLNSILQKMNQISNVLK